MEKLFSNFVLVHQIEVASLEQDGHNNALKEFLFVHIYTMTLFLILRIKRITLIWMESESHCFVPISKWYIVLLELFELLVKQLVTWHTPLNASLEKVILTTSLVGIFLFKFTGNLWINIQNVLVLWILRLYLFVKVDFWSVHIDVRSARDGYVKLLGWAVSETLLFFP